VDRPHNGHRRHDTGSITVVDLIRRQQQGPVRIPSADEASTVQFVDDLLGADAEIDRPRGWMSKSAKLAGLALGSLALCGSVVAASTLTHHRVADAVASPSTTTILTGAGALRPDTVAAELSGKQAEQRSSPASASRPAVPGPAQGSATGTIVGGAPTTLPVTEPEGAQVPKSAVSSGHLTAAQLVRAFYRLVGTDPSSAVSLLSPSLLAADPSGFARAWSSMSNVRIEDIQQNKDGSVQAVIRMLEPDGAWLRVVELLDVTGGDDPQITGAELLSAQHG
jgi:hypothetical protein